MKPPRAKSPYDDRPPESFWRSGVTEQHPLTISGLYHKKFEIRPATRIATAGSCFAQHIARNLRERNFRVLDVEPPPLGLSFEAAQRYGYLLYSARYGNIYTVRHLLQLLREATGAYTPTDAIWQKDGRFYDAMRPSVEPHGLPDAATVTAHRESHLNFVRRLLKTTDLFIFTLGLTEAWIHAESETTYPTAPGTIAGTYDPAVHAFKNYGFDEIYRDFVKCRQVIQRANPDVRFLLTVSPVPLVATASHQHVLPATVYSKSVLRAVAGQLEAEFDDVDYFPSYEIIASHFSKGFFYEPNLRSVAAGGVEAVMRVFFDQHEALAAAERVVDEAAAAAEAEKKAEDVICEEVLLEAFANDPKA